MMVQERLWIDHHPPHPRTDLVIPMSPENGFSKDQDSPETSDSEDLHYGPGIVNRLRNKYLSLAFRESNSRPSILRKATSLENLLDDDGGDKKADGRLFTRRSAGVDRGNRYTSNRKGQEMKRARSVEVISRNTHDEELSMTSSVTAKINNRQSLHEDMLLKLENQDKEIIENNRSYKKLPENGGDDGNDKFSRRINRPKRIPPLLNEREKPPVDVVKQAKMIFEKRPETRTKKPQHTGEVAAKVNTFNSIIVKTKLAAAKWNRVKNPVPHGEVASKVDSFNDIIVKTKVALKSSAKPAIKSTKPVLNDKYKSNTHVRPVAKPVIISEELAKPKSLDIRSPKQEKKGFNSLPSPIPDVSRVDIKKHDGTDHRNSALCETPDLILTSSPLPKITSPSYRKQSTEHFIEKERNGSYEVNPEATNKYISPLQSPTKTIHIKPNLNFNRDDFDGGIKMISPISQNNITKSSPTAVFNFLNSQVDQRHLPKVETNGFHDKNKDLSPFELEKNLKNVAKSIEEEEEEEKPRKHIDKVAEQSWQNLENKVEKTKTEDLVKVEQIEVVSASVISVVETKISLPKKIKPKLEETNCAVFNFTGRRDVPDYIANDTSRVPSRPAIPKPDEPGIKLLPEAQREYQELCEENELIRSLEARPPSPCDITFFNDNILIDGKSSLVHNTSKRAKLKISFVDDAEIYEYPSEISLLLEEVPQNTAQVGHTVPALSGSSLATYTPKTTEDFQLGITKSFQEPTLIKESIEEHQPDVLLEEIDQPVLFSAGSTSDILF